MGNVCVATDERGLAFIPGSAFSGREPRELALASLKYIYTDLGSIRDSYFRLGFHLDEFERMEYYLDFGFGSMAGMCEANFGLGRSAYSRCIGVFREFCMKDRHGSRKIFLDDRYRDFSYSQLVELLPMDERSRRLVSPSMTISEIRELKKREKGGSCCDAATGGTERAFPGEPSVHDLKVLPEYFEGVISGRKKFELRENDRDYRVGDRFVLREWEPCGGFTGRHYAGLISYVLKDCPQYGLADGFLVFGWQ